MGLNTVIKNIITYSLFRKKPPNIIRGIIKGGARAKAVVTELADVETIYPEIRRNILTYNNRIKHNIH